MRQYLLIADRDADRCEVFRRFLTERGYEVETSTDGLGCVAKLRQVTPALLMLDLELLWGGGDGVLAWLREESPAPRFPVLLTAPAAGPPAMAAFNEPPVVDYLPRPFALAGLLERIRSAIAKKGRREPSNLDREHLNEERDALQATAPLLTQSQEDHGLAERIERALRATGYGALRTVRVSVNAGVVLLGGRVSSYYLKQVAQATALAVAGAHQIRNGLDVVQPH